MALSEWIYLAACVGHLALCFGVLLRGSRNSLALPLGLLSLDLFVWNFAGWAFLMSKALVWRHVDMVFSPFTLPLWFHFVLVFAGRGRTWRLPLIGAYALSGFLSLWSLGSVFIPELDALQRGKAWSLIFLAGIVPVLSASVVVLVVHLRASVNLEEQMRTRLVIAAGIISGVIGSSDLWDQWLVGVPAVSAMGVLVATLILASVVFRFQLFGRMLSTSVALYAVGLAVLGVAGYLAVVRLVGTDASLLIVGVTTVTVVLIVFTRNLVASFAESKARLEQLAAYGRFSAQMAHDLKNPLAALKGALQYLAEERAQGRLQGDEGGLLELSVAQADRIEAVIEKYRKLTAVDPVIEPVTVNDLVCDVLSLARFAPEAGTDSVTVRRDLADGLPDCGLDRALVSTGLENLVRNGCEAMPDGGVLTVRTSAPSGNGGGVIISVEDTGTGMDARQLARATDDFFTTKATGSGLGLAFVQRVAAAHGGSLRLSSVLGRGTVVELHFPVNAPTTDSDILTTTEPIGEGADA